MFNQLTDDLLDLSVTAHGVGLAIFAVKDGQNAGGGGGSSSCSLSSSLCCSFHLCI